MEVNRHQQSEPAGHRHGVKREEAVRSHRSEATKLSGARMPKQRRAGQLVAYMPVIWEYISRGSENKTLSF